MPGPLPKAERQRERDTKRRQSEYTTVTRDGVLRGPTIEDATGSSAWEPFTRKWWETWRAAPQAALFEDTDWSRLATLAFIFDGNVRRPSAAAMSEIRMNEERLGATYADRLRARIRVTDGEDADVVQLRSVAAGKAKLKARFAEEPDEFAEVNPGADLDPSF
jgi:hypothetical protein